MHFLREHWLDMVLACILLAAALNDLRFRKIPNLLTYPMIALSLIYYGATGGLKGLAFSTAGLAVGMAVLMIFYLAGGMGAGDVKLMGAVGAALGPRAAFEAFLVTAIVGGIYSVCLIVVRRGQGGARVGRWISMVRLLATTGVLIDVPGQEHDEEPRLSYGVAIAFGTLCTMIWHDQAHSLFL